MVVGGRELIDTLWNVNKEVFADAVSASRINRYIMECKWLWSVQSDEERAGINRYIMECKYF